MATIYEEEHEMDNFQDWTPCQWSGHRYDDEGWCTTCGEVSEDAKKTDEDTESQKEENFNEHKGW